VNLIGLLRIIMVKHRV